MSKPSNRKTPQKNGCPFSRIMSSIWDMGSRRAATLTVTLLLSIPLCPPLHAQGCTQCRDNTAATPPKTQTAYRHAIILMALTASGLFLGTVALLKRQP
jgi:hypothetical protein